MNAPRFLISTTFQGRKQTKTWDSTEPVMLGRSEKGPLWVLERTMRGDVRVRSLASAEGEVSNAHSQILSDEQMKRGVQVRFKKKEGTEIAVEIKSFQEIHPSLYRRGGENADLTRGFSVYSSVGDWNAEHSTHKTDYVARLHDQDWFHVCVQGNTAKFRPIKTGLTLEIGGIPQSLDAIIELDIRAVDFFNATVKFGLATWYFGPVSESRRDRLFEIPAPSTDADSFRKISAAAVGFLLLFFGVTAILPERKATELPIPPQVVKILVQKKKEKVAAKKEIPAPTPEAEKKPAAQSEQVAAAQPKEVIVPKGGQAEKPSAPTPTVAKASPSKSKTANAPVAAKPVVRVNKAANLFAGIMKGGLMKINDSQSLSGVTKLGSGIKVNQAGLSNLAAAMGNLNVDVNAGGAGDTKVQGFGGTANAGSKGSATVGYAEGAKGVVSGTGGGGISLGTGEADVEEGLTKEEVGKVIHAHIKEVKYCYDSSMIRTERVDGKIILDFTINGSGRVSKVVDRKPASIADPGMTECIMRRLKTWQFPNPKGGVNVDVSYPFIFRTLGGN